VLGDDRGEVAGVLGDVAAVDSRPTLRPGLPLANLLPGKKAPPALRPARQWKDTRQDKEVLSMSPLITGWDPALSPRAAESDTQLTRFDDHLATELLAQRIIFLGTQVDEVSANRICAQLLLLSARDPRTDISLCINSPGGLVTAGLAIYDTMRLIPNDVSTLAMGFAASMGQFLLTVGAKGKRYALPNARVMMHQPSAGIGGTTADVIIQAENHEFMKKVIERITAEHTGQSEETISRDGDRDRWFTAEQAREYGMVDRVVDSLDDVRPAGSHRKIGL
jgi:ATP-dependent Clp protease protease subunit